MGTSSVPSSNAASASEDRSGLSEQKRRDLADFLRSRREKMKPETVGIAQVSRRRTPGLRREEVAELAGVGTTWYTWLEQARDIQPSSEVLRRLARALMLNGAEMRHLYALAGKAAPSELDGSVEVPPPSLLRLIEESLHVPAFILGIRWDVLAINARAAIAFPWLKDLASTQQNLVEYFFCDFDRSVINDWSMLAKRTVAEFRSTLSDSLDHPWVLETIEALRRKSPEFDQMWREHDVFDPVPTIVEITRDGNVSRFERTILRSSEDSRHKIMVLNPIP
ncbi:MAG: helix-turn-helix transcriptional regulator [Bdellovibrionota bacterium]